MRVLVLNAGSSSLKFDVWESDPEQRVVHDQIERVENIDAALAEVVGRVEGVIDAVGHRVVHGGDEFHAPAVIDCGVESAIDRLGTLAPLHNPFNLAGIRAAQKHWPGATHVAVFDTAFHHTLPPKAFAYGLPHEYLAAKKIRRYGFHGISHQYVSQRFAEVAGRPAENLRLITCHLGNGCSVCAIQNGNSVDTSMGFTPLEGLLMGTRSGDIDPGAVLHLILQEGEQPEALLRMLNSDSGLKGLSGISNDMRDVLGQADSGNKQAELAVEVFCYRVKKYIGAYMAAMGGADAVIFTGGIGENSAAIRARIFDGVDADANRCGDGLRQIGFGPVAAWVIPTNEELLIAREASRLAGLQ